MSYTIIPDLPPGGKENGYSVNATKELLVIEQDITRKITPLSFLSNSIAQLNEFTNPINGWSPTDLSFTISDNQLIDTKNVTLKNLMSYINTHLNVIDEVFFVSSVDGVDSDDFEERGRNEQLPFRTIKYAAYRISKLIAEQAGKTYDPTNPTFVQDDPSKSPTENSQSVRRQYTIMVRSGDYVENNPVYLPPCTSMIGDNLRRTTIRPLNPRLDMFWVDSANYIWGFTFRDHKSPSAATAFPISEPIYNKAIAGVPILSQYAPSDYNNSVTGNTGSTGWVIDSYEIAYKAKLVDQSSGGTYDAIDGLVIPKNRPYIFTSPYIQGCTSYAISDRMPTKDLNSSINNPNYPQTWFLDDGTPCGPNSEYAIRLGVGDVGVPPPNNAGMGARIDGSLVTGYFRSFVVDSFTQINQGGLGIYLINHGYAQFVSTFTVATYQGIVCEAGATCSISTSNSTFGLSGLVGKGMSFSPVLTGQFVIPATSAYPIPSESSANGNTYNVYGYSPGSNLFTINNIQSVPVTYPYDDVADVVANTGKQMVVASQPYATLCFTVGDDKPWITGYDGAGNPTFSGPGYITEDLLNPTIKRTQKSIDPALSNVPMHQVKLFFIEQGAPTPSLSGGITDRSATIPTYDIYDRFKLSHPTGTDITTQPTQNLPWDIYLSYNIQLDLTRSTPISAYDATGRPLHYYVKYDGSVAPLNYKYYRTLPDFQTGTLTSVTSGVPGANAEYFSKIPNGTIDFTNAPVKFYARSVLETGSHTFEYMGTGTRMKYAIPAFGGVTNNANECAADGFNDRDDNGNILGNKPGIVFFTSSNELGNFKVGTDFTIVQSTGTIQGDTFSRAILTLVTPLTIVLE